MVLWLQLDDYVINCYMNYNFKTFEFLWILVVPQNKNKNLDVSPIESLIVFADLLFQKHGIAIPLLPPDSECFSITESKSLFISSEMMNSNNYWNWAFSLFEIDLSYSSATVTL